MKEKIAQLTRSYVAFHCENTALSFEAVLDKKRCFVFCLSQLHREGEYTTWRIVALVSWIRTLSMNFTSHQFNEYFTDSCA